MANKIDLTKPIYWNGHKITCNDLRKPELVTYWLRADGKKFKFKTSTGYDLAYDGLYLNILQPEDNFGWSGYTPHRITNELPDAEELLREIKGAVASLRELGYKVECSILPPAQKITI